MKLGVEPGEAEARDLTPPASLTAKSESPADIWDQASCRYCVSTSRMVGHGLLKEIAWGLSLGRSI